MATITITISVRWWFRLYLSGVIAMCELTGLPPDWDKIAFWAKSGMKIEVL